MTPRQILVAARAKIEDPSRWTQGLMAIDASGSTVKATSDEAACWCSQGAILSVLRNLEDFKYLPSAEELLDKASGHGYVGSYVFYNDSHSHAEVMAMFDRAIELAIRDIEAIQ